ncbi:hypothetical protein [Streptomyces hainanensis]|uniref:hypothetical protein n=1 Tax=Streptomyces hainanensis TaxID=402648 RepID=UPI001404FC05|nr:hypothetical protein [Streptomyces hainanensis]
MRGLTARVSLGGVFLAVSLMALAAVLGYHHGHNNGPDVADGPVVDSLERQGDAVAAAFRAAHPDDPAADLVRWALASTDAAGYPALTVVVEDVEDEDDIDAASLCASVAAFLAAEYGVALGEGHTELLVTAGGSVLRRFDTTP